MYRLESGMRLFLGLLTITATAAWTSAADPPVKLRIGYGGGACEGFFYVAKEKGYWAEEGLDVEFVKIANAIVARDSLALGKIDATDGMFYEWIKPLEAGLDAKMVAGLHTGCVQIIVAAQSPIKSADDLKGKTIGVPEIGGPGMIVTIRSLAARGIDATTQVTWKVYPLEDLTLALKKGEIDAAGSFDPLAQLAIDSGEARSLIATASDPQFKEDYCCFLVVNGKLVREKPEIAAKLARGALRGAVYTQHHSREVATLAVQKQYIPGSVDANASCISQYSYRPAVQSLEPTLAQAIADLKKIGVINPRTDPQALAHRSLVALPGADDAYVKSILEQAAAQEKAQSVIQPTAEQIRTAVSAALSGEAGGRPCCPKQ